MDLLERYLHAVSFFLPAKQQDDIIRELSENLLSQIEDREEELGRTLDEAELAEILRRHGHPMLVAGRYRSQQHLIGPVFFPIYVLALKMGLGVAAIVTVVLAVISVAMHGDPARHVVEAFGAYFGRALMVFGWTTLGFALLDLMRARVGIVTDWDPRRLPKVVRHKHRMSRTRALCDLLFGAAGLVWVLLLPWTPFLLLGPAAPLVEYAPIWRMVYPAIVTLAAATVVLYLVNFLRPYWTKARSYARLAINASWLVVLTPLIRVGQPFVAAVRPATLPEAVDLNRLVDIINASFQIGFVVMGIIVVIEIVRELHRLKHAAPVPPNPMAARAAR